jgi:hypothetical protein
MWRVLWDVGPKSASPGKGRTRILLETHKADAAISFVISDSSYLNFNIVHYVLNYFGNALQDATT